MSLVEDFRNNVVDRKKIRQLQASGFDAFRLKDAIGVRPSLYHPKIDKDDPVLATIAAEVRKNQVVQNRIGLTFPIRESTVITKQEADATWVDREELRGLDDVCTKFCTNKFFPTAFARMNLICDILSLYQHMSHASGLNYKILFKGGVMLRLVMLESLQNINYETRLKFIEYIDEQKAARISDFDFEIMHETKTPSKELVHRTTLLNYLVLLYIKNAMNHSISARADGRKIDEADDLLHTEWDCQDASELVTMLQEHVDELDETAGLYGARIDHVTVGVQPPPEGYRHYKSRGRTIRPTEDMFIFKCNNLTGSCTSPATQVLREMGFPEEIVDLARANRYTFASHNDYVGEDTERVREQQKLGFFQLNRIKHNFVVYYTTKDGKHRRDRLKGEMVDLSCGYGPEFDELKRFLYATDPKPYKYYNIIGVAEPRIYSYTPHGFLLDHRLLIHSQDVVPWEANKIEKRLFRYVIFLVLHTLSTAYEAEIPMKKKLAAFHALVADMKTGMTFFRRRERANYGLNVIDEFVECERASFRAARTRDGADEYTKMLTKHLTRIVALCQEHYDFIQAPKWTLTTLKSGHLENWQDFFHV
jgi:hypothetical protein